MNESAKVVSTPAGSGPALEPLRFVIDAAPMGMLLVDEGGRIRMANSRVEKLFGYRHDEIVGLPVEVLVPESLRGSDYAFRAAFLDGPRAHPMGAGHEILGLRKDGTEIAIEIGLSPLPTPRGMFVLASVADISERKQAEREREHLLTLLRRLNTELERRVESRTSELRAALQEREVLLQEVQHRVKNNLQVISSLISRQARSLPREASREALEECQAQVQAMALVHEKLYQSKDYARVPFSEYVRTLAESIFEATGGASGRISLRLGVEEVSLAVDRAIPCGLVLNELITNALKHAFPDGRTGTIRVGLTRDAGGGFCLEVADDGVGLRAGCDVQSPPSLGLDLVQMLARQLDGRLEFDGSDGSTFRLTVPGEAS